MPESNDVPIYWTDPYRKEFDIEIIECKKNGDFFEIKIKPECLRAAGGGQAGDRATLEINGKIASVLDTVSREGELVLLCDTKFNVGDKGRLIVDMNWRLAMMRNHSAEHLFAGHIVRSIEGAKLGYIWIDGEHGTIDIDNVRLTFEQVFAAEREVQKAIIQDLPVETEIHSAGDLEPEIRAREGVIRKHEKIRIVRVEGHDSSACSGTHVSRTGEIEFFKIIDVHNTDTGTRLEFLTSGKAVSLVTDTFNLALSRKYDYPFEMEQLGAILDKGKKAIEQRASMVSTIESLMLNEGLFEDINGVRFKTYYMEGFENRDIKSIIRKLRSDVREIRLFFIPGEKCNLTVWTNDLPHSANEYVNNIVSSHGGRGGGSDRVYTGGFIDVKDPFVLYEQIVQGVRERLMF